MTTKNFRFKSRAFQTQSGRCYYCDLPMWQDHPEHFALRFGITLPQSKQFQCTAEHLLARQDGGPTSQSNIVAACLFCNQKRHQRKIALNPVKHKEHVKKRLFVQKWHPVLSAKLIAEVRKTNGGMTASLAERTLETGHEADLPAVRDSGSAGFRVRSCFLPGAPAPHNLATTCSIRSCPTLV